MKIRYYGFPILIFLEVYVEYNFITRLARPPILHFIRTFIKWSPTSLLILNWTLKVVDMLVRLSVYLFVFEEALRLHLFLVAYTLTCVDILEKLAQQMISATTGRLTHSNIKFYRAYEIIVRVCNDSVCVTGYAYVVGSIGLCAFANFVLISYHHILPWFIIPSIIICVVVGVIGSQMALYLATLVAQKSDRLMGKFKDLVVVSTGRRVLMREMKSLRKVELTLGFRTVRFMAVDKSAKVTFLSSIIENTANALMV